ncbi:UNKNOWN [Stylonychia lemnae]|uniref:Uncharacterized protein n=1 Tax=Stylonychia lemnae TaxID=5949 RepID=A0A078A303_STYLE|nr:UNKNOWN [Stylonychia lemnae]|eukprot:CDW76207.1 UNKNOWN [Stylonychia lemnae]
MKKEVIQLKNEKAAQKFNGNDFDPMNQLKSGVDHLNYQIADFRAKNTALIASENRQMQSDIDRMRNEEEKQNWRDHYKDKYKQMQMNNQMTSLKNLQEQREFLMQNKLAATSAATNGVLSPYAGYGALGGLGPIGAVGALGALGSPLGAYSPYLGTGVNPYLAGIHNLSMYTGTLPGAPGPVPYYPPWGVNPYSLHQPYYMKRNPTYDYLNTQEKLFNDTFDEIADRNTNPR